MADVIPAPADLRPELLEEHLWNTDPKLNGFMFRSRDVLLDVLRCEWPETRGLLCHAQALVVMDGSSVSGLLIGHTAREYGPNFEAAKTLQMGRLKPDDKDHMDRALDWMDRLFPQPGQRVANASVRIGRSSSAFVDTTVDPRVVAFRDD